MEANESLFCAALDLSKAFDSICHHRLQSNLVSIGFDNFSCALIHDFLTLERVIGLHASKKAAFVRTARKSHLNGCFNDKCKHALQEKQDAFRTFSENQNKTNRKHYREKQRNLRKVISSNEAKANKDCLRQLSTDKDRLKFINEQRNSVRFSVSIDSLRNSLGDVLTGPMQIAELLNYKFSKLGEYLGCRRSTPPKFRETEHEQDFNCFGFRSLLYAK